MFWFLLFLFFVPTTICLKCYTTQVPYPWENTTTTAQDCPVGALSCTKNINYQTKTYDKACSFTNCTSPTGITNSVSQCWNITGADKMSCCCYGDGCNSTTSINWTVAVLISFLIAGIQFK